MPEVRFGITVDDKGSPVVQSFDKTLQNLKPTTEQVNAALTKLGVTVDQAGRLFSQSGEVTGRAAEHYRRVATANAEADLQLQKFKKTSDEVTKSSEGLNTSLLGLAKSGAAFAAGVAGFAGVTTVLRNAIASAGDFQTALLDVGIASHTTGAAQDALKTQILALNPTLASSTDYAVALSKAIRLGSTPDEGFKLVSAAAQLAGGDVQKLSPFVETLSKTINAFNKETLSGQDVAEAYFQAFQHGATDIQALGRATLEAAPYAKQLGIDFRDNVAILTTLSGTFKSTENAGEAYRVLLSAITQNQSKFAAAGIDVAKVYGEQGFTNILRKLIEVTGGNAEALQRFGISAETSRALLALLGADAEKLSANFARARTQTDELGERTKQTTQTMQGAYRTFVNSLDNLGQEIAPPLLNAFTAILNGATATVKAVEDATKKTVQIVQAAAKAAVEAVPPPDTAASDRIAKRLDVEAEGFEQLGAAVVVAGKAVKDFFAGTGATGTNAIQAGLDATTDSFGDMLTRLHEVGAAAVDTNIALMPDPAVVPAQLELNKALDASTGALIAAKGATLEKTAADEAAKQALDDFQKTATTFNHAVQDLGGGGVKSTQQLQTSLETVQTTLKALVADGHTSGASLVDVYERAEKVILEVFGKLPPGFKEIGQEIRARVTESADGLPTLFHAAGQKTKVELATLASEGDKQFTALLESGQLSIQGIQQEFHKQVERINTADLAQLPEGFQTQLNKINQLARQLGGELFKPITDQFGKVRIVVDEFGTAVNASLTKSAQYFGLFGQNAAAALQKFGGQVLPDYKKVLADVNVAEDLYGKDFVRHLDERTREAAEAYGILGRSAEDFADKTKASFERAAEATNAYGNALVKTSTETQKLLDLQASFESKFSDTVPGLLNQLAQARQELQQLPFSPIQSPGYQEFTRKALQDTIDRIIALLKDKGVNDLGEAIADTVGKAVDKAKQTVTGGSTGAGSSGSSGAGGVSTGGSGSLGVGGRPAQPVVPGARPQLPGFTTRGVDPIRPLFPGLPTIPGQPPGVIPESSSVGAFVGDVRQQVIALLEQAAQARQTQQTGLALSLQNQANTLASKYGISLGSATSSGGASVAGDRPQGVTSLSPANVSIARPPAPATQQVTQHITAQTGDVHITVQVPDNASLTPDALGRLMQQALSTKIAPAIAETIRRDTGVQREISNVAKRAA